MKFTNIKTIEETCGGNIVKPNNMEENEPIYQRNEIENLPCFNGVFKDGKKYYLENPVDACIRVLKRAGQPVNDITIEDAEFVLYKANYDIRKAVKMMG